MNQCSCSIDVTDLAAAIADGIRKAMACSPSTPTQTDDACCEPQACCATQSTPSTVVVVCGCSKP